MAEAWAKRCYPRHFVSKLSDALGEAEETVVWVAFAGDCGYLTQGEIEHLETAYRHIVGGLVTMIHNPSPWCGSQQGDHLRLRASPPPNR